MSATLASLIGIDERLAARGRLRMFAPGSWWLAEAASFYGHPSAREWWAQVGRAGAKSTCIYRVAENETLCGEWTVPPPERHWSVIASRSKDEAAKGASALSRATSKPSGCDSR